MVFMMLFTDSDGRIIFFMCIFNAGFGGGGSTIDPCVCTDHSTVEPVIDRQQIRTDLGRAAGSV